MGETRGLPSAIKLYVSSPFNLFTTEGVNTLKNGADGADHRQRRANVTVLAGETVLRPLRPLAVLPPVLLVTVCI
jgi:hypothetical protein